MKKIIAVFLFILFIVSTFAQSPHFKILAIGDSNGEFDFGWVTQLQKIRSTDKIINTAISGNTIGFDNLGRKQLNTLRNVDSFMEKSGSELNGMDAIVIMLGTNDCKAVFTDSLQQVAQNMRKLISKIKAHHFYKEYEPEIFIVSPPPFGPEEMLIEKYRNGSKRIEYLQPRFREIAKSEKCAFIDIYSEIKDIFKNITSDGIHLTPEGQKQIAEIISQAMDKKLK